MLKGKFLKGKLKFLDLLAEEDQLEILVARNPSDKALAYHLRYLVYCVEHQFEDIAQFPDEMEIDEFDDRSIQCLIMHKTSKQALAGVRLVCPQDEHFMGSLLIHQVCKDLRITDPEFFPKATTAEVSRFFIYRKAVENIKYEWPASDKKLFENIFVNLIIAISQLCLEKNITHLCAVLDQRLFVFLNRLGFKFEKLGALVDFRGLRQPCFAKTANLRVMLETKFKILWQRIVNSHI
jgi:N-acyl amino acid synthase of PEP-CTERM/exosortase system